MVLILQIFILLLGVVIFVLSKDFDALMACIALFAGTVKSETWAKIVKSLQEHR